MAKVDNLRPSVLYYRDKAGTLQYVPFIGTLEENHSGSATISKYPVQNGFEVSNHMIRHNKVLTLKVVEPEALIGGLDLEGASAGHLIGSIAEKFGIPAAHISTVIGGVVNNPTGVLSNYVDGLVSAVQPVSGAISVANSYVTSWVGGNAVSDAIEGSLGIVEDTAPSTSRRITLFQRIQTIQEEGYICGVSTLLGNYGNLILVNYQAPTTIDTANMAMFNLTFEEIISVDSTGSKVVHLNPALLSDSEIEAAKLEASKLHSTENAELLKNKIAEGGKSIKGYFSD